MIIAAHQPGYLPSISFFQKMCVADIFVLTDDFQYTSSGKINRTQIKTVHGSEWVTVPVRTTGFREQKIKDVRIDVDKKWQRKHWKSLQVNYTFAAYFEQFEDFFQKLYETQWQYLFDLNNEVIDFIKSTFNLKAKLKLSSEMTLVGDGNLKLINMAKVVGATTFLAEPKFKTYLNSQLFKENGIELNFFPFQCPPYHQEFGDFLSGLSIVDLLFNEGITGRKIMEASSEK